MTYFVTGADGWLGRGFVSYLRRIEPGAEITGLTLGGNDALDPDVRWREGDVRDPASLDRFFEGATVDDVLVHLVGIIHPRRVRDFDAINATGTLNTLAAARAHGVRRAVVMSSNSPIGCNPFPEHRFDEDSPYAPYMGYGRSKRAMELGVKDFAATHDLEYVLVRAPWFYGPYQPPRQTLFFTMVKNGRFPMVGDGRNVRSMSYIENLARGLHLAATRRDVKNETFWIADRRAYPMTEIVETVGRVLSEDFGMTVKPNRLRLPYLAGQVAQVADAGLQRLGLYQQKIHVLSEMNKSIACTIEKAAETLGYAPEVDLREGMRRSVRWCLDQGLEI